MVSYETKMELNGVNTQTLNGDIFVLFALKICLDLIIHNVKDTNRNSIWVLLIAL